MTQDPTRAVTTEKALALADQFSASGSTAFNQAAIVIGSLASQLTALRAKLEAARIDLVASRLEIKEILKDANIQADNGTWKQKCLDICNEYGADPNKDSFDICVQIDKKGDLFSEHENEQISAALKAATQRCAEMEQERDALIKARESYRSLPCGHDGYWKTHYGHCMACYHVEASRRADKAESNLKQQKQRAQALEKALQVAKEWLKTISVYDPPQTDYSIHEDMRNMASKSLSAIRKILAPAAAQDGEGKS